MSEFPVVFPGGILQVDPRGECHVQKKNRSGVFSAVSGAGDIPPKRASSRAFQVVHGDKELVEKLGRNDLCPCGSGRRF
jgi:uncharacterized protein YecA (UPF0149 family)